MISGESKREPYYINPTTGEVMEGSDQIKSGGDLGGGLNLYGGKAVSNTSPTRTQQAKL